VSQLGRFDFERRLSQTVAELSRQMLELRQLRELLRLAEGSCDPNSQYENRRFARRTSTSHQASGGACHVQTKFLTVDPGSEILLSPADKRGALA
jgi:hypothetical protein